MRIPEKLWNALDNQVFFTIPQAAEFLHCDERTIRKAITAWNAGDKAGIPSTKIGMTHRVPTSWLRSLVRPMDPGPCDLCGEEGPRVTDHCYRHNEVRGALCPACNVAIDPAPLWYRGKCPDCQHSIRLEIAEFEHHHPEPQAAAREPGQAA